jgi:D-arabinose 1-dehydrogenase-like Zn-dependent alcohol dehydrogenase
MSKAGKIVKSGAGQGGPTKWEAALLAAQFEAVILKEFGDPRKVLTMENTSVHPPSENEVLVKMLMAPINPSDINMIEGTYHNKSLLL